MHKTPTLGVQHENSLKKFKSPNLIIYDNQIEPAYGQYKTRTADYGLGIKHGLGIKRGLSITDWV